MPALSPRLSPAELDAQYNNRALVPDFQRYFDSWVNRSVLARQQACVLDVTYSASAGEKLDIFPAKSGTVKAPVMVFIHGGYWRSLDKRDHSFIAPSFTKEGVCVVVVNYDLCPAVSIPQITMQMVKAVAWVYDNIGGYGGDASNITVVGHSAGGHMAAMLLACRWAVFRRDLPTNLVRKAVSISGLFDLEPIRRTPFLKDSLRLSSADASKASPARLTAPSGNVLYAIVGGAESNEFIRQNQLIVKKWGTKVVARCENVPTKNHFSVLDDLVDNGEPLHLSVLSLLKQSLD
jgi:arylformamidase